MRSVRTKERPIISFVPDGSILTHVTHYKTVGRKRGTTRKIEKGIGSKFTLILYIKSPNTIILHKNSYVICRSL